MVSWKNLGFFSLFCIFFFCFFVKNAKIETNQIFSFGQIKVG